MELSTLLVGEVAALVALGVVGTALVAFGAPLPWPWRREGRPVRSEVPAVLFCPRIRRPARVRLAAVPPRPAVGRPASEPELTVVDCEYLSRTGLACDLACLEGSGAPESSMA